MSGAEEEKRATAEVAAEMHGEETGTGGADIGAEPEPAVETRATDEKKIAGRKAAGKKTAAKKSAKTTATKAAKKKSAAKKSADKKNADKKGAKKKSAKNAKAVETESAERAKKAPKQKARKPETRAKSDAKVKKPDTDAVESAENDPFTVARRRVRQSVPKIVDELVKKAEKGSCVHAKTLLEMTGARHMFDGESAAGEAGEPWAKLVLERLQEAECTTTEDGTDYARVAAKESGE